MTRCGYVCPKCEGKGITEDGEICDWCSSENKPEKIKLYFYISIAILLFL